LLSVAAGFGTGAGEGACGELLTRDDVAVVPGVEATWAGGLAVVELPQAASATAPAAPSRRVLVTSIVGLLSSGRPGVRITGLYARNGEVRGDDVTG